MASAGEKVRASRRAICERSSDRSWETEDGGRGVSVGFRYGFEGDVLVWEDVMVLEVEEGMGEGGIGKESERRVIVAIGRGVRISRGRRSGMFNQRPSKVLGKVLANLALAEDNC